MAQVPQCLALSNAVKCSKGNVHRN